MKLISASIIALTGAVLVSCGSLAAYSETRNTLQLVGSGIGIHGLLVWYREFNRPSETPGSED
jgi:hypothetical protein